MDYENLQADVNRILPVHYTPGRSGKSINKVVVHYNAADLTIDGCYNVWLTREASAHYQVESGGRIGQLVNDWDTAWHTGEWNSNCESIGIEHANQPDGTLTEACLDAGAHLVAAVCRYYGLGRPQWLVNVFPHKHFSATACPGQIYGSQKDAYILRAQQWYDAMNGGSAPVDTPVSTPSNAGDDSVRYALKVKNGEWLPEVVGFNNYDSDGYAGIPHYEHDLLYINSSKVKQYRVHTIEDGWLPFVYKGDKNDTVNGCAGIVGHTIDGVDIDGDNIWFRSQTTERSGWLPACCEGVTGGDDTWAGMYGEPLDRLQVAHSAGNPF